MTIIFGLLIRLLILPFTLIGLVLGKLPGPVRIIAIIPLLIGTAVAVYFAYQSFFPGTPSVTTPST